MTGEYCRLLLAVSESAIPVAAEDDGLLGEGSRLSVNAIKEIASAKPIRVERTGPF